MTQTPKKRGRPKGSKNKLKETNETIKVDKKGTGTRTRSKAVPQTQTEKKEGPKVEVVVPKKRGRPKGSKNKISVADAKVVPTQVDKKPRVKPKPITPKKTKKASTTKKPQTRGEKCYAEGQDAEKQFLKLAKGKDWELVRKATKEEDMESHWDYMFKTPEGKEVTVDIKNMKKRHKKWTNKVLVEFRTVHRRGTDHSMSGWIYGKADYIAFRMFDYKTNDFDCFLVIDREKLKSHATQMVMGGQTKIEGRDGRGDKYCYLPVNNLMERGYVEHIFGANRFVFPKILALGG